MSYALVRSENTTVRFTVSPHPVQATAVHRFDHTGLVALIWPTETPFEAASRIQLLARIEQLEQQLAELEHLQSVRRATLASAASFHAAWDDESPDEDSP